MNLFLHGIASIIEDLQAALEQFTAIAEGLGNGVATGGK